MRDNLNLIIVNQILTYNKIGRGYEQKNNSKSFSNIFVAKRTSKSSKHKCNYYGKNDHVTLFWFMRKSNETKLASFSCHFYSKAHENNIINVSSSSYFYDCNSSWKPRDNMHCTNIREPKWFGYLKLRLKFIIRVCFGS